MKWIFAALMLALCGLTAQAGEFGESQYKVIADDGSAITNFDLGPGMMLRMQSLKGLVPVGNPAGDVTLYQFYDLNCPFCRAAAHDIDELIKSDPKLKLVFVPYPVLSVDSVRGGLVEVIAARMLSPEKYLEFHRRLYDGRGRIDGARSLETAVAMGLDRQKIVAAAQTEETLAILKSHADFGSAAKLVATPAYVVNNIAIVGHPGLKALRKVAASVRQCGKVACS